MNIILDFILNVDKYIFVLMQSYGLLIYILLFLIILVETGVVVMPFLPGDSILFACGALAASGDMNYFALLIIFISAAFLGDNLNYYIGKKIGTKLINKSRNRFIKREHVKKTKIYFEKHGGKAVFLARFIPIIRTFAPFVAGISHMEYKKFGLYNALGAIIWVTLFLTAGYLLGNFPLFKEHFSLIIIIIVVISFLPATITFIKEKNNK